jgi:hypothetical protein
MEEQEFRLGVHKTPSMLDYKSPTSMDMCSIETVLVEEPDPVGPFGAKEVGQGPLLPIHRSHRLADVADDINGERMLVLRDGQNSERDWKFASEKNGLHTIQSFC